MEPVIGLSGSVATERPSLSAPIWQDVLAQAMTGELMAAMNYTSLSEICDDPEERPKHWSMRRASWDMPRGSLAKAARSAWMFWTTWVPGIGNSCAKRSLAVLRSAILLAA